mgnify:CR=1 FL=1|jgi:magnesium transporter
MITVRKSVGGTLMTLESIQKNTWIDMINPSDNEVDLVSKQTGIPDDMLKASLDEEESAHIDYEGNFRMIIVDIPIIEEENDNYVYNTIPLSIITGEGYFVTVCLKETSITNDFAEGRIKSFSTERPLKFILQILYRNSVKFLSYLKQIDKTSHRIQSELQKSMKNKEIFQLLELEKSLVYFSTASKANQVVIEKIAKFEELKDMPEEMDLLNDLIIENKQAIEMCNIYREILTGTMDAFASIINNNVNIVMKLLTIITIIMSLPTLIASLWGMNVPVPFGGNPAGFWLVLAITLPLTVCFALLLINKTRKIK